MNQSTLVQIAERLERLAAKLPERIRRPVLRELIPLKQLFLQQRRPRFLFVGSSKTPMPQIIDMLFAPDSHEGMNVTLTPVHRWTEWTIPGHGTVSILDARGADNSADRSCTRLEKIEASGAINRITLRPFTLRIKVKSADFTFT